jgi:hypothetical protein
MARERRVFRIQVQDKWVSARLCSFLSYSRPRQYEKRGWHIMRRLIVLCLIFLSVLSFPGNATAIIIGEVWSTGALSSAQNPALGPPKELQPDGTFKDALPNATFTVNGDINFAGNTLSLTFGQFLNSPLDWKSSSIALTDLLFSKISTDPDQGIFFRFTFKPFDVSQNAPPVTVIHDDGINFSIFNVFELYKDDPDAAKPVTGSKPVVTSINLKGVPPGNYSLALLDYGALNDSANHVLIYNTPEPWTILLLGLGMLGLGILRRKI